MMYRVAEIATRLGVTCRWEIEPENTLAQRFYRKLGVEIRDKKVARWSGASLQKAATGELE